jgi:hypothetical protein
MPDDRLYIKVHNGMPDHPKIEPLSDAAFRAYIELLCLCAHSGYNGKVPKMAIRRKVRAELVTVGLVSVDGLVATLYDLDGEPWTLRQTQSINGRSGMSSAVRERVLRRDGEVCNHCATADGPWHIDHVLPVAHGGTSALGNLQVLCEPCNRRKATLLPDVWAKFTAEHARRGTCGRCA